ncbi:cysteine desulfurase [Betaproteobacteria bacterium]|nr:cysteine desulfurase [Betaproteobacteria bacterium]
MTTPTSTSNGLGGLSGLTHAPTPESLGLPGEAELARLANQFFNELPNQWEPGKTCPEVVAKGVSSAAEAFGAKAQAPDVFNLTAEALAALASSADIGAGLGAPPNPEAATNHLQAPPHSVNPAPRVAGAWQTGGIAGAALPADTTGLPDSLSSRQPAHPVNLLIPLPEIRELEKTLPGASNTLANAAPNAVVANPGQAYYFLAQESAFPSGINVPGTLPYGAIPLAQQALSPGQPFDVQSARSDFPILRETVSGGRPLIWLDNAATTQKPQAVIDRLAYFYAHENSNIHRAAHELAARSTDAFEGAREIVRRFVNARSANEIVFVRGTTEGINLVAQSWGRQNLKAGDEILITWLEHHANIVPWQQLAAQTGAVLKVAPVDDLGQVCIDEYEKLLSSSRVKLVSFTQVSNALGTVTPAALLTQLAHAHGAKVLVDGAQSVSHMRTDVTALDCDWFVFSGHKVFGPTGIGAVYGKEALLNATDPWQGGGNMIRDVTFEKTLYHDAPARFEAGTGNIADAVGLGAALEYVEGIGIDNISRHEHDLLTYGTYLLEDIPGVRLIGKAADKAGVLSFVLDGHKTEDIGAALSKEGIAVRAGHHCAQPILRRFGLEATVRPSLALYNTHEDLDALAAAVRKIRNLGARIG